MRVRSRSSSTTKSLPQSLHLEEDRFFDPAPSTRRVARAIYDETQGLPLLCPHGHVDDLSRRVDANWLAGLVARHIIDLSDAREMARALAYDLAREAYKLDRVIERAPEAHDSGAGKESAA
jgi:glucuronate isomerase